MLAITALAASEIEVAILAALSVGAGAVVGLVSGGIVDRTSKRHLLIGADLFRLVVLLSVPIAAYWNSLSMAQLCAVTALAGSATAMFQIADNTYLPALVRRDQLIDANARLETTEATAEIVGPGIAGVLMELITAPLTILLDAITYLISAVMISRIEAVEELDAPETSPRLIDDLSEGARAVFRQPTIRWLYIAETTVAFWNGFFFALYYLFTLRILNLGEGAVGVIISVGGVGALLGSAAANRISDSDSQVRCWWSCCCSTAPGIY